MSEPIKAGDWVQVVKPMPCCGDDQDIGRVFQCGVVQPHEGWCLDCGNGETTIDAEVVGQNDEWFPVVCLKKLPPLTEDEQIDTEQDQGVPA